MIAVPPSDLKDVYFSLAESPGNFAQQLTLLLPAGLERPREDLLIRRKLIVDG